MISRKSNGKKGGPTSSLLGFPVSHTPNPENDSPQPTQEIYGMNALEQLARYDRRSHSLRTSQGCLLLTEEDFSTAFLATWQKRGMMRNGKLYRHPILVRSTKGKGCGFWPTPMKGDWKNVCSTLIGLTNSMTGRQVHWTLIVQRRFFEMGCFGRPIPEFAEWLMMYPIGWTELAHAETQSSPK